jgi:RES domain-containing protein
MEVYRFTRTRYAGDLTGFGASRYPGRWNLPGQPALYTACSRALALLEILVHLPRYLVPEDFLLQVIEIPEVTVYRVSLTELPANWKENPPSPSLRRLGGGWLDQYPAVQVPSTIIPSEWNMVIGPGSLTGGNLRILQEEPFPLDGRLFDPYTTSQQD